MIRAIAGDGTDDAPLGRELGRSGGAQDRLRGLRVLIVEDEFFVALELEQMLSDLGCRVVATAPDFGGALQAVNSGGFDAAVLDINLNGQDAYPVADLLFERRVPFVFATGYAATDLPERFRSLPRIEKPVVLWQLREGLFTALNVKQDT